MRILKAIWQVPAWVWLLLALVAALAIPHELETTRLPDEPVFAKVRPAAQRQLVIQCIGSTAFLVFGVVRWVTTGRLGATPSDPIPTG